MNLEAACGWPTASNSRQKEFGVGDSYSQGNYETWGYPIYGHLQLLRHGSLEKARASGALPLLYIRTPPLPPKHFFFHHHILKHTHNPSKQTTQTIKMETIKNAANYVAESVQGGGAQASKEANKQVAKDGDASVGTRASAAKDAVSDKIDQSSHEGKADLHKEAAKH